MAIRYTVEQATNKEQLILSLAQTSEHVKAWSDGQRMLVDSDQLSFIYVLETADDLIYIDLPQAVWPQVNEALIQNQQAILTIAGSDEELPLSALHNELLYLLENIKDNSNYGEQMQVACEASFTIMNQ
ncbi:putative phosphatase [Fictibacillus macauensis ZFHKF-1]|uniref:Putative phosphatase n=1 Tax=Fictibacillus macauensis ZFHKF-1 TaxID=1196324 RepID=I8AG39_9BACL|nr:hypothetical protein [Fictibacillus macauensis]EIT84607.1 putative phosphatase [Fictibacillus macauensis ZFHKF-1]